MWSGLSFLIPKILAAKKSLPPTISSRIDITAVRPPMSMRQLSNINALGMSIGLEREDIIALIDNPVADPRVGTFGMVLRIMTISALIVVVLGLTLMWRIVSPETFPIPTYVPGTLYGTIKPQDFLTEELLCV